jgi:hypothetical protein
MLVAVVVQVPELVFRVTVVLVAAVQLYLQLVLLVQRIPVAVAVLAAVRVVDLVVMAVPV